MTPSSRISREEALQPVRLYQERESPKLEKAAMRWLERHLTQGSPRLQRFAEVTASLTLEPDLSASWLLRA
jgi:hypothetical protein